MKFSSAILMLISLLICFFSVHVFGEPFTASLYEIGSDHHKLLFHQELKEKISGDEKNTEVVFTDPLGKEVAAERTVFKDDKVVHYTFENKETGEKGVAEVKDNRIWFSHVRNGKTEKSDEKWTANFVIPPSIVGYLKAHWGEILAGDDVDVRFGALERAETVGFKFFKIKEFHRDGKDLVTVKMKPTSFIIAAVVSPLIFTFEKDDVRLIELEGRTLPKQKVGDKWKDLDADVVFKY